MVILDERNVRAYAELHYENKFCISEEEFNEDLLFAVKIRKLLIRQMSTGVLNVRGLVNSTISFYNMFEHHAATNLLKYYTRKETHSNLNAFLTYLSFPVVIGVEPSEETLTAIRKEYENV